jgi:3-deoxy-7-phosphoheptulonate synthase
MVFPVRKLLPLRGAMPIGTVRRLCGEAFLLQGGDCAESFAEFHRQQHPRHLPRAAADGGGADLRRKLPVVKVGRMAGQFAKPRSAPTETIGGVELPSYRGDIINGIEFTAAARSPTRSAWCRPTTSPPRRSTCCAPSPAAMPTCTRCTSWTLDYIGRSPWAKKFAQMADRIGEALDFMKACGIDAETVPQLQGTSFYTSHEALLLPTSRR